MIARLFLGRERADRWRARRMARRIGGLSDRKILSQDFIPAFAKAGGRILWVGCEVYTVDYYALLEAEGGEVWTTDIVERAKAWGRPSRHRTGDVCSVDEVFPDMMFDAVICNGVLGYGVNTPDQQRRALASLAKVMVPGGRLLLGWNTDKIADPLSGQLATPWFAPAPFAGLPAQVRCPDVTHVYDSLTRL